MQSIATKWREQLAKRKFFQCFVSYKELSQDKKAREAVAVEHYIKHDAQVTLAKYFGLWASAHLAFKHRQEGIKTQLLCIEKVIVKAIMAYFFQKVAVWWEKVTALSDKHLRYRLLNKGFQKFAKK